MSNQSVVRVLVVDDFAPWRRFVLNKLRENRDLCVIAVVSDGLEAVVKAEALRPDLILLDIGLPKLDGIGAARRIRMLAPESKILFLSQELDPDVVRAALNLGAHGYVVKMDAERELLSAMETIMLGRKFVSSRLVGHPFTDVTDAPVTDRPHLSEILGSVAPLSTQNSKIGRCHEVQFYSDDALFLDSLTRFTGAALRLGDAAIVFATESHRNSLLQRLQERVPDLGAAIKRRSYISMDAAEALSTFMSNDLPDPARFLNVVGDLIVPAATAAMSDHPRVALCGECAPLLRAQGNANAAIRLEQLWNEVARTYDVDILCGYPLASFRSEEDSHTFRRICGVHSAVHSL